MVRLIARPVLLLSALAGLAGCSGVATALPGPQPAPPLYYPGTLPPPPGYGPAVVLPPARP